MELQAERIPTFEVKKAKLKEVGTNLAADLPHINLTDVT